MAHRRKVILAGELGKRYGEVHYFVISTAAEAVKALCANFKDFRKYVCDSSEDGVGYKVIVDQHPTERPEELHYPVGNEGEIMIVPVMAGAKSGFGQILIGAALIGLSFVLPVAPLLGGALGTMSFSSIAFNMGLSLALGGLSSMLSRPPKAAGPSESPENKPSYAFDGPINTTAQGHAVPIGYGKLIVGSSVISGGITAENYSGARDD